MGKLTVENGEFVYTEKDEKKILLNCKDYFSNKSRIPLHSFDNTLTIPGLLLLLFKQHSQLREETGEENDAIETLLIDVLLSSVFMKKPRPVKVLEIGCQDGILSYHLATLLGLFHKDSSLCCVCNMIGNDSGNQWLDRISCVEIMPKLSMLASDYEDTHLQSEHFDIVVINGSHDFQEPFPVLKEAARLAKPEGMILCYANRQPLLVSSFQLLFALREEYTLTPMSKIMVARGDSMN